MTAPSIHISNLSISYGQRVICHDLSFTIAAGKWTALLGSSGIGKSSLLRALAGFNHEHIQQGQIRDEHQQSIEPQIAYMAQSDLLLPWSTVLDNILLGFKLRGENNLLKLKNQTALSLLEKAGLHDASDLYPSQLSGGMRQRVALIRTLIEDKPIVLMDEPFSALDTMTRHHLQTLAFELLKNKTVFFITHDPNEALRLADDIYIMQGNTSTLSLISQESTKSPRILSQVSMMKLHDKLMSCLINCDEKVA